MPNQKNGVKGQCIHQECTGTIYSPVKSLAGRVHDILSHHGTANTGIYHYFHPFYTTLQTVSSQHINTTLKQAAGEIGLYKLGYEEGGVDVLGGDGLQSGVEWMGVVVDSCVCSTIVAEYVVDTTGK